MIHSSQSLCKPSLNYRQGGLIRHKLQLGTTEHQQPQQNAPADGELRQYFATCIPGLHKVLANELLSLGAANVETSGTAGVRFTSNSIQQEDIGLKALLWLRTAHRLMELIATTQSDPYYQSYEGMIRTKEDLYKFIQRSVPVKSLLGDGQGGLLTLSVSVTINGQVPKELCHTHYTALTVKNALVDQVREMREDGIRPDVDIDDPDVPILCVLRSRGVYRTSGSTRSDWDVVEPSDGYLDVSLYRILHSGGSLHRRGYRFSSSESDEKQNYSKSVGIIHKAALKESLAAGLLLESGWHLLVKAAKDDGLPAILVDPMSGSGTLPIEAALIAADYAPGLMRIRCYQEDLPLTSNRNKRNPHQVPPCVRWKGSNMSYWKSLLSDAKDRAIKGMKWMQEMNKVYAYMPNCLLMGNEINVSAADLAYTNIESAGFANMIKIRNGDCVSWTLSSESSHRTIIDGRTIITTNPPWGLRLSENIEQSWKSLREFLQRECEGSEAWVLSGNKEVTTFLRMKKSRSLVVQTADEDLRWIQYHIRYYEKKQVEEYTQQQVSLE